MKELILMYLAVSLMIAVIKVLTLNKSEKEKLTIPPGDLEYYDFGIGISIVEILFFPSIIFVIIWRLICLAVNKIFF